MFQAIDRSILETVLDRGTSKAIWNFLNQKYQGSTKVKHAQLQTLRAEFELLRIKEVETLNEYFAWMLAIVGKMKIHVDTIDQNTVVEKALRSLLPKFNYVVCAIELVKSKVHCWYTNKDCKNRRKTNKCWRWQVQNTRVEEEVEPIEAESGEEPEVVEVVEDKPQTRTMWK